jgi:hypothetical protein
MVGRRYVPSGQMEEGALPALAVVPLAVGVLTGFVEALLARWFDLLILFPALIGVAAGYTAMKIVDRGKVRRPLLAGLLACFAGLAGQAARQEVEYRDFRAAVAYLASPGAPAPHPDAALRELTGRTGRLGYLLLEAEHGVEVKKPGAPRGFTVKGGWFWLLFVFELLVAGAVAFELTWRRASAPFCERCKRWYGTEAPLATGAGEREAVTDTLSALEASDWVRFARALGTATAAKASALLVARCEGCADNDARLTVKVFRHPGTRKEKSRVRFVSMVRPDELREMERAIARERAASS